MQHCPATRARRNARSHVRRVLKISAWFVFGVALLRPRLLAAFAPPIGLSTRIRVPNSGFVGTSDTPASATDTPLQPMRASGDAAPSGRTATPLLRTLPLVIYCVVNWAGSAELLQMAQKGYPQPLVLTVVGALAPVSALPFLIAYDLIRGVGLKQSARELGSGFRKLLKSTGVFAALHLGVEFLWITSLAGTTVGTNVAIYNTYLAFVCIGSVVLGLETMTRQKLAGVALGLGGLALIWRAQSSAAVIGADTAWGVSLCLLSTLCFSAYQLFCDVCGGEEAIKVNGPPLRSHLLWTTSLGVISCAITVLAAMAAFVLGAPLPAISWPSAKVAYCMAAVVLLQMTYQLGLYVAIGATSALLVAGGSVTVIPTGFAFDFFCHGIVPSGASVVASTFIIAGFVLLLRASMAESERKAAEQSSDVTPAVAA